MLLTLFDIALYARVKYIDTSKNEPAPSLYIILWHSNDFCRTSNLYCIFKMQHHVPMSWPIIAYFLALWYIIVFDCICLLSCLIRPRLRLFCLSAIPFIITASLKINPLLAFLDFFHIALSYKSVNLFTFRHLFTSKSFNFFLISSI